MSDPEHRPCGKALFLLPLVLLAGCGGGGDSPVDTAPAVSPMLPGALITGDYFPMAVNDRMIYSRTGRDLNNVDQTATMTQDVVGVTVNGNGSDFHLVQTLESGASDDGHVLVSPTRIGLIRDNGEILDMVRFPLHKSDRFEQQNRKRVDVGADWDGDGIHETVDTLSVMTVIGVESTTVPAGVFPKCLKLVSEDTYTYHYSARGTLTLKVSTTDWFAEGVGNVRSEVFQTVEGYGDSGNISTQLTAYRVGDKAGDHAAPAVTAITPAEGTLQGPQPVMSITFDEAPLIDDLAGLVTLTDDLGHTVPGVAAQNGASVSFTTARLATGHYTLRIAPAYRDRIGNRPAAAVERHFSVDADAPSVAILSPAEGALVPLRPVMTLRFSDDTDTATLNTGNLHLHRADSSCCDVPVTIALNGNQAVITPTEDLNRAARYVLEVGTGVLDRSGNALPAVVAQGFVTETGILRPAVSKRIQVSPEAVAVADLTGDGRNDIVAVNGYGNMLDNNYFNKVYVFAQQPDGALADAAISPLHTRDMNCAPTSLAVADLNGDGVPELAVGEGNCGIEIMGRSDTGGWITRQMLTGIGGRQVRTGDFNHDGRPDIAALSGYDTQTLSWWLQDPAGALGAPVSLTLPTAGWGALTVGDINNDGLADVILTGGTGSIGVALQRAAGGFAAPYLLQTGIKTVFNTTLGDLNADGRNDLLLKVQGDGPIRLMLFLQNADGTLAAPRDLAYDGVMGAMAVSDLDRDGRNDVVSASSWLLHFMRGAGDGTLGAAEAFGTFDLDYGPNSLAIGDVNNDGYPDVVSGSHYGYVQVMYNNIAGADYAAPRLANGWKRNAVRPAAKTLRLPGGALNIPGNKGWFPW